MKKALVMEGGAMRGLFTAGVIDAFLDEGIEFDNAYGTSAGALFGINYASKQRGRVLRYNKKLCKRKDYMSIYSWLTTGNIVGTELSYNKLVYEIDKFDFETCKNSKTNFYSTVTNLETGQAEYIKVNDLEEKMDLLRAGGSMPLVSKIVETNGGKYLDGGIADSIPFKKAFEDDNEKVVVVLTRPSTYVKKKTNMFFYNILYSKYPLFRKAVKERPNNYNSDYALLEELENEGKVFIIRPKGNLDIKKVEHNPNKIQKAYDEGFKLANEKMDELKKYLNI